MILRDMTEADLDAVLAIERAVHAHPWTLGNFSDALRSRYQCKVYETAAREMIGYAVMMLAVDEDTFAFSAYLDARRLPAGTAEEKARRDAKMQEGLKLAVEVPLRTARLSYEAMETAEIAMQHGNPNSITDAMVPCDSPVSTALVR